MQSAGPPAPDTSRQPIISGQSVVEVIYSTSSAVRGIVTIDPQGIYRVRTEYWDVGDWAEAHRAYWNQDHIGTFTDSLENARRLCHEHIAASLHNVRRV
jgi:hypothetical protein